MRAVARRALDAPDSSRRAMWHVFLLALAVRLVVGVSAWTFVHLTGRAYMSPDEQTYFGEGDAHLKGLPIPHFYGRIVGQLYSVFGAHQVVPRLANVLVGALLAVVAYELARQLRDARTAWVTGLLVAVWPSLVVWSVQALKDPLTQLAMITAALAIVLSVRRVGAVAAAAALGGVLAAALAGELREWVFPVVAIAGVGTALFAAVRRRRPTAAELLLVVGLGLVGPWLDLGPFGIDLIRHRASVEAVCDFRTEGATGVPANCAARAREAAAPDEAGGTSSSTTSTTMSDSPATGFAEEAPESRTDVVIGGAKGLVYTLVGPFPWQPRDGLAKVLLLIELPFWYAAIAFAAIGARSAGRQLLNESWFHVATLSAGIVVVISVYVGNAGIAFRQRGLIIPIVLCLTAIGWLHRRTRAAAPATVTARAS